MKPVRGRFGGRSRVAMKRSPRLYGLPKREVTRRLSGVNLSLHSDEAEITTALTHIDDFLAEIRRQPCALCGRKHNSEAHHVLTRGARNGDFWNVIPACAPGFDACHQKVHAGADMGVDLEALAVTVTLGYLLDHQDLAAWLSEHGIRAPDLSEAQGE